MTDWVEEQHRRIHGEEQAETGEKGGPGSGHHGHAGRPGKRGGSAPGRTMGGQYTSGRGGPEMPRMSEGESRDYLKVYGALANARNAPTIVAWDGSNRRVEMETADEPGKRWYGIEEATSAIARGGGVSEADALKFIQLHTRFPHDSLSIRDIDPRRQQVEMWRHGKGKGRSGWQSYHEAARLINAYAEKMPNEFYSFYEPAEE